MRVKTLKQTTENYVSGSVKAFLYGEKDLKWISGTLLHSGLPEQATLQMVLQLSRCGDPARTEALLNWLQRANWQPSSESGSPPQD